MIRIREDDETAHEQRARLLSAERAARQSGDAMLADSYEFAASRVVDPQIMAGE